MAVKMDFDAFDAPQFVDFSRKDFDASAEGDSWFSASDSASASDSDLQIEELEFDDDLDALEGPGLPYHHHRPPVLLPPGV